METEAEIGVMQPQLRNAWSQQQLEEARKDPPLEPPEGAWPNQHLDFGPLASGTVRESMVVLSPAVCDSLFQHPQQMNALLPVFLCTRGVKWSIALGISEA